MVFFSRGPLWLFRILEAEKCSDLHDIAAGYNALTPQVRNFSFDAKL
ncbi:Hypothetical protein PP7435_CHR2-2683 [Komagataella phaffii CBS 7435]|uniref:Uncharacterized protein n=1 Tax=Komagataella phaffii (strain ATCC 76273 / CBS 7435 / CECT 11047 / NRRL Y-11430 / Wegner 21-1) TaxID=981350 RepID=A0A1G4KQ37_KOMPC|nr:Hypothetical protein BQ9382_C2-6953 [Komagataella phaffii CBS 7435]SCV12129.1 Hypothetical protein PP7435_CHR2-2683 [Komagataella phaffii CBS 7435]